MAGLSGRVVADFMESIAKRALHLIRAAWPVGKTGRSKNAWHVKRRGAWVAIANPVRYLQYITRKGSSSPLWRSLVPRIWRQEFRRALAAKPARWRRALRGQVSVAFS
jgi:hypothetical protein